MTTKESPDQQHEGPWLDRLFPVRLPGGRIASVTAFSVLPSNLGILEGGLTRRINSEKREQMLALAKKRLGEPVVVVEPVVEPLIFPRRPDNPLERYPWMVCMARLTSAPLVQGGLAGSSELTLVWWQDRFDAPLPVEIERAAAGVDWERSARDVEFW